MYLVHKKKGSSNWEVAWTWLPFFLAADQLLHKHVDKEMTTRWAGLEDPNEDDIKKMNEDVIQIIVGRYPVFGLYAHLRSLEHVHPDRPCVTAADQPELTQAELLADDANEVSGETTAPDRHITLVRREDT